MVTRTMKVCVIRCVCTDPSKSLKNVIYLALLNLWRVYATSGDRDRTISQVVRR